MHALNWHFATQGLKEAVVSQYISQATLIYHNHYANVFQQNDFIEQVSEKR